MNRASLSASLVFWRSAEEKRYRLWRRYVKTRTATDPKRVQAHADYSTAVLHVRGLVHQLAKLPISLDADGIAFICEKEGVIPYAYPDSRGFCTAYVGHLIRQSACTVDDYKKFGSKSHPGTHDEAIAFFLRDVRPYERAVRQVFDGAKLDVTNNRFNACVSLCLNIGIGGFRSSTTAKLIRAGDAHGAAQAMMKWDKPPEIIGRRETEVHLFEKG